MNVREELVALYRAYNPRRLAEVDDILEQFRGRERSMLAALRERYTRSDTSVRASAVDNAAAASGVPPDGVKTSTVSEPEPPLWPAARAAAAAPSRWASENREEAVPRRGGRDPPPAPATTRAPTVAIERIERSGEEAGHSGHVLDSGAAVWRERFPAAAGPSHSTPASSTSPRGDAERAADAHRDSSDEVDGVHGSRARRAEMQELLGHMGALDLAQLAERVAALVTSTHRITAPPARVPRLQWAQRSVHRASDALDLSVRADNGSPPTSGIAGEHQGGAGGNDGNVTAVVQHSAVFLSFFAQCARRFLELAHAESAELDRAAARHVVHTARHSRAVDTEKDGMREAGAAARRTPPSRSPSPPQPTGSSPSAHASVREGIASHPTTHDAPPTRAAEEADARARPRAVDDVAPAPRRRGGVAGESDDELDGSAAHDAGVPTRPAASPASSAALVDARQQWLGPRRRPSCVREVRHVPDATPPSPSPPSPQQQQQPSLAAAAASPHSDATASPRRPRRRRGSGSPPTYRTTTVSPLTSPETPTRASSSPHASPPPHPPRTTDAAARRDGTAHAPRDQTRTPPPPTQPLPQYGALVAGRDAGPTTPRAPLQRQRVHTWTPSSEPNRYSRGNSERNTAACAALRDGDCVVLQPGVYYESLVLEACGHVELTSAYPGAAVVLRPSSDLTPALTIRGAGCCVALRGIVLVQGTGEGAEQEEAVREEGQRAASHASSHRPPQPSQHHARRGSGRGGVGGPRAPVQALLAVRDGAELRATACHFYGGAGGGVAVGGANTRALLDLCLISRCGFAGVYVHGGASAQLTQSKVKKCEAGLRAVQATFIAQESTLEENSTDGLVVYQGSMGLVEQCCVLHNGGNGIFLEGGGGAEVRVVASTVELNALYGVQRFRGSTLHVRDSFIRDNGLLPISEEAA